MCGLFGGISSVLMEAEIEAVYDMGFLSALRGIDSSGLAILISSSSSPSPNPKRKQILIRQLTNPVSMLLSDETQNAMNPSNHGKTKNIFLMAGHARYASVGSVTEENIQPLQHNHIIGMHNGTIPSLKEPSNDLSDSKNLIKCISEEGIKNTIESRVTGGSYALVYIDSENKTLNFIRNEDRPLSFCWNK